MSEAICLMLDVGASASRRLPVPGAPQQSTSFLDAALECTKLFLERKLFMDSKDDVCLVLFGTEDTANNLDYENIRVSERGYVPVDWDMLDFVRQQIHGTNEQSDWSDALIVGLDTLNTVRENKKYEALKLVLISDLGGEGQTEDFDHLTRSMKMMDNFDLTYIGTDQLIKYTSEDGDVDSVQSQYEDSNGHDDRNGSNGHDADEARPGTSRNGLDAKPLTKIQKLNKLKVGELSVDVEGTMCSLDDAVATFFYKSKKGKKPSAWKVNLEIGPDIKISTTGYVKMRRETPKTWKNCLDDTSDLTDLPGTSTDDVVEVRHQTRFVRNNEDQEEVGQENINIAYSYGKKMVLFGDADEEMCKVETGAKSMSLIGFVDSGEIEMSDLTGNGSMAFIPSELDDNSQQALSALVQGMMELGVVGIVRRVYRKGSSPIVGVLAPETDTEGRIYLAYSELPYADERRLLPFPSLDNPRHPLTAEQIEAVDQLIDEMPLEDDTFIPENELNPQYQYMYQALAHRAYFPKSALPKVPERLKDNLKPSESVVSEESQAIVQNLMRLFPTEEIVQKSKRTAEKVFGSDDKTGEPEAKKARQDDSNAGGNLHLLGGQTQDEGETIILCVGSVNPVEDFEYLLSHSNTTGATLQSAGSQMEEIVQKFVASAFGSDLNIKIIKCLKAYRRACVVRNEATLYNNFIRLMKTISGDKLWEAISKDSETGLVRQSEVDDGGVQDNEAEAFFSKHTETQEEKEEEEEDMEDLL